jgi:cytochrome-b5 reductase
MEEVHTLPNLFQLSQVTQISPDTKIFRFSFPDAALSLNIPVGHYLAAVAKIPSLAQPEGELVKRKYTPLTPGSQPGYFDLLIKVYSKTPQFPDGGKMTQFIDNLRIGDSLEFTRPKGKVTYQGQGKFVLHKLNNREVTVRHIGMIAGGSGITPMYQMIRYIVDHDESISLHLIFANKTEADILLRPELETLALAGKLHLWMTLDSPPETWSMGKGFVTREMLETHLPPAAPDVLTFICGPPPMSKALKNLLGSLGHDPIVKF